MNKEDEDRQIRETRSLLQKASQRNAPLDTRRDALRRLIGLTHMPSRELKVFAAQNFSHYFKDFPDIEEDVIDSVYDICEDTDAQVRIEGYKAIVALSKEAKKWTRRNTDVLVQLLQSDEPVELKQIEDSLIAHVNLDPAAAIGVLCDHCSLDPDLSVEDKEDREKLRKLVLLFLATKAKKDIFAKFGSKDGEAEQVFREGLLKAIGAADVQETELIVKELLLSLDSYKPRSDQGDELLRILLDKVRVEYTQLRSKPGTISLAPIQAYLALLDYVVIVEKVADPAPLLRFYSMTLIGKMALQKLDPPSQMDIIQRLADILAICEEERRKQPEGDPISQELISLRNMVVDACPHLVERLIKSHNNDRKQWKASLALLQACRQRRDDGKWTPPTNLTPALNHLNMLAERAPPGVDEFTNQIKSLIKGLHVEPSRSAPPTRQPERNGNKRKFENEGVSTDASSRPNIPLSKKSETSGLSQPVDSGSRGAKLINRLGGDVSVGERTSVIKAAETPTLLRRMSSTDGRVSNGASTDSHPQPPASSVVPASVPVARPMLNIKGAASKLLAKEDTPQQTPTLIDRMQTDDLSREGQGNFKRKRRHKAGG